jgi:hypothetical protein
MTTNPVLTLSPRAIARRRQIARMNRERAKLGAHYELYTKGVIDADAVIHQLAVVHSISRWLDAQDTVDPLDVN